MREIKFRGKSLALDTKGMQWVYGSLIIEKGIPFIYEDKQDGSINYHQVVKETVGQYTGLKDKNGVEIYEGDIVKQSGDWECDLVYEIVFGKIGFDSAWNGLIGFALKREDEYSNFNEIFYHDEPENIIVIGNIHEQEKQSNRHITGS